MVFEWQTYPTFFCEYKFWWALSYGIINPLLSVASLPRLPLATPAFNLKKPTVINWRCLLNELPWVWPLFSVFDWVAYASVSKGTQKVKKIHVYACRYQGCEKTFSRPHDLQRHEKIHCNYNERYVRLPIGCIMCKVLTFSCALIESLLAA